MAYYTKTKTDLNLRELNHKYLKSRKIPSKICSSILFFVLCFSCLVTFNKISISYTNRVKNFNLRDLEKIFKLKFESGKKLISYYLNLNLK